MFGQISRVSRARRLGISLLGVAALVAPVALTAPAQASAPTTITGHFTVPQELLNQAQNSGGLGSFGVIACQGVVPPNVAPKGQTSPCPTTSAAGQPVNPQTGDYTLQVGNVNETNNAVWYLRPYWNSVALQSAVELTLASNPQGTTQSVTQHFTIGMNDVAAFSGTVSGPNLPPPGQNAGGAVACLQLPAPAASAPDLFGGCQYLFYTFAQSGPYTLYVPPGTYKVSTMMAPVSVGTAQGPFTVSAGAAPTTADFSIATSDLGTVPGQITMSDGSALPSSVQVRACFTAVPNCGVSRITVAQGNGSYEALLPAPAGGTSTSRWELNVTVSFGGGTVSVPVERVVTPGATALPADFEIDPSVFGHVTGHVTMSAGSPPGAVGSVRVVACPASGFPAEFYAFCQPSTPVDANTGNYTLDRVAPGSYKILAFIGNEAAPQTPALPIATVSSGQTATVDLAVDLSAKALVSAQITGPAGALRTFIVACPAPQDPGGNGICSDGTTPMIIVNTVAGRADALLAPGSWSLLGVAETTANTYVGTAKVTATIAAGTTLGCSIAITPTAGSATCIAGAIDAGNGSFASANPDQPDTTGSVVSLASGLSILIEDATAPAGVRVKVTAASAPNLGEAVLNVCPGTLAQATLHLTADDDVNVTCGSVTLQVVSGPAELAIGDAVVSVPAGATATVDDGATDGALVVSAVSGGTVTVAIADATVSVPAGATATVEPGETDGTLVVSAVSGGAVTVAIDGTTVTVPVGSTFTTWTFSGFSRPVDNAPVLNVVTAGQAVPLKWRMVDASGAPVTTITDATIKVASLDCSTGTTTDPLEGVATGDSGLQNLGNGYYQMNWKTPKSYAGSCKTLKLDLGEGVTRGDALIQFKS